MKAKQLCGKQVFDVYAKLVGKVIDVELDIERATITAIYVKTGWMKKISISPKDIDRIGDKVLLKMSKDKIKKA
jgi:sporulation protein YlmC with PRC-barrel domain